MTSTYQPTMQPHPYARRGGFTLVETVLAVGVLAILLTAFFAVFALATKSVRRALSVQDADRLAYGLQEELTTLRGDVEATTFRVGFNKAFAWIEGAAPGGNAVVVYQYRGILGSVRDDGTLAPYLGLGGLAGQDFVVQTVARRQSDTAALAADLEALEGRVYTVVITQLIYDAAGELIRGTPGQIVDPRTGVVAADGDVYPAGTIAFAAEFVTVPVASADFISTQLNLNELERPVFTRNLAVRR